MKTYFPLIYYGLLLIFMSLRVSEVAPPLVMRVFFIIIVFTPVLLKYTYLLPACIVAFYTVCVKGFSYGLLPYSDEFYMLILIFAIVIGYRHLNYKIITNKLFLVVLVFMLISLCVDLFVSGIVPNICNAFVFLLLFSLFINDENDNQIIALMNMFCLLSLAFSITYLVNYERFLVVYNVTDAVERSGWIDPNYFSSMVGVGVLTALLQLFQKNRPILLKFFWGVVIVISFIAQVLMASRGGILATVVGIMGALFFSKIKIQYKILFLVLSSAFIVLLYTNNFFDLLFYRLENESGGGGSGRLDIWMDKLNAYANQSNILHLIFGQGVTNGINSGSMMVGFHNDFIAFLCCYGIIGISFLIYFLLYPLRHVLNSNRHFVIVLLIYLVMVSLTLEPIESGTLTTYGLYFLIYTISMYKKTIK